MTIALRFALAAALVLATAGAGLAQPSITEQDLLRLQQGTEATAARLPQVRARDASLAAELQRQLDALRDEIGYLKVTLRKQGTLSPEAYADVRNRLGVVDGRVDLALGKVPPAAPPRPDAVVPTRGQQAAPRPSGQAIGDIPVNQQLDVRLQSALSSETAQVEDRFEATTLVDLYRDGKLLVPAGTVLRGVVSQAEKAGRVDRKGSLTLSFDQLTLRGQAYPIRAMVVQTIESAGVKAEAGKIALGAGVGGIIGGVLGGTPGLVAGLIIGSGGALIATPGKNVELPQGTVVRIRFDSPVTIYR